ncbi:MAG: OsmC family protein [Alphaproteobacteria bacterium]
MPDTTNTKMAKVNGIDVDALMQVVRDVEADPKKGMVEFRVMSNWTGQTKSRSKVESYRLGGERIARAFSMAVDEPFELLGENTAPNPQEYLMTALNACIMVGYVAGAAVKGIKLDKVEIESTGMLDLRGFLGIDASVRPGYDKIKTVVRLKGKGTAAQFQEIHETVMKTSPNYFNVSRPIPIDSTLIVE